jgi:hypothetical protein
MTLSVSRSGSTLYADILRLVVCDENFEMICEVFVRSTRKSSRTAVRELQVPHSTMHRVQQNRLCLYAYKLRLVQEITPGDRISICMTKL